MNKQLVAFFCIFCIVLTVNASTTAFGFEHVVTATIQMYHSDWENLLATADEENWYPANLQYDDVFVQEVGVRTKGHSSLSGCTGSCTRFSLKIDMQKYVDNQTLFGEHEINFNNVFKDPSYMREAISWKILREYVPAEQTAFADLYLQTEKEYLHLGFYTVIEQIDKKFLADHYQYNEGDLYKLSTPTGTLNYLGDSFDAYTGADLKTNKHTSDGSSFVEFVDKINHETSVSELRKYLNVNDIVYTMAVITALVDLDSPIGNGNNFYVYQSNPYDPANPQFTIIPWDVNEAFGTFSCQRSYDDLVSLDIFAPVCGQIQQFGLFKLLQIEEFRNLYSAAVQDVVENYVNLSWISEQVDTLFPIISPFVAADDNSFYSYDQFICATTLQSSPPSPSTQPMGNGQQQPPSNGSGQQQPPSNGSGQQQPPSTGNQQPPSNGSGQQQPPSNGSGQQQPPSTGNQQPPSNGSGQQQPPSNGSGQQQPPSNGSGQQQPPSNGSGQQQPPSNGSGQQQPPSNGSGQQQPPSNGNQQPPSNGSGQQQPPSNGSGQQQPPSNGSGQQQPPSNGSGQQQPPSTGNQQPPSNGSGQQQPPSNGSGQQQPPSNGSGQQQPPSTGNQQPPSNGSGQQQPPSNGSGQQQPPSNGSGQQPPSNGSGQQQPPSNGSGQQQPPSTGNQQPPSNGSGQQQPPSNTDQTCSSIISLLNFAQDRAASIHQQLGF